MKIYVIKELVTETEIVLAFALSFRQAKNLVKKHKVKRWVIEEWPIGIRLNPCKRREAWSVPWERAGTIIPAGTLIKPYGKEVI